MAGQGSDRNRWGDWRLLGERGKPCRFSVGASEPCEFGSLVRTEASPDTWCDGTSPTADKSVTSSTPSRLGIQGGSNGGLLMGNMLARSPELFGAIVCQVPLLDMRRYNKLLAGASWMGEYGNPDVAEEWSYLGHNSPYHTLKAGASAPPTLFTTSCMQ